MHFALLIVALSAGPSLVVTESAPSLVVTDAAGCPCGDRCECDPCTCPDCPHRAAGATQEAVSLGSLSKGDRFRFPDDNTVHVFDCRGSGAHRGEAYFTREGTWELSTDGLDTPVVPLGAAEAVSAPPWDGQTLVGFSASWCVNCPAAKSAASGVPGVRWLDVDTDAAEVVELLGSTPSQVPYYATVRDGKVTMRWQAPRTLSRGWLERARDWQPTAPPARTISLQPLIPEFRGTLAYGRQPSGWTWPGDLRDHLRRTHGIEAGHLSDAEAIRLHDQRHNAERRGVPVMQYQSGCPGGVCPR